MSIGEMRLNSKTQMNQVNPIAGSGQNESMLSAIKNKRRDNAMKSNMMTTSQPPLNLPKTPKVGGSF